VYDARKSTAGITFRCKYDTHDTEYNDFFLVLRGVFAFIAERFRRNSITAIQVFELVDGTDVSSQVLELGVQSLAPCARYFCSLVP
jgi:hypothetical protein